MGERERDAMASSRPLSGGSAKTSMKLGMTFPSSSSSSSSSTFVWLSVVFLLVLLFSSARVNAETEENGKLPKSPEQLAEWIVTDFPQASACVLLLHSKGQSGCFGEISKVPLRYFSSASADEDESKPSVVIVRENEVAAFFEKLADESETSFVKGLKGALIVRSGDGSSDDEGRAPPHFSPAARFPHANFAPYANKKYAWNPMGLDLIKTDRALPPMYVLGEKESEDFRKVGQWNERKGYKYPQYVADLNTQMLASKDKNSFECLDKSNCLPLGGYSVLSTLPSTQTQSQYAAEKKGDSPKECVLVLAQTGNSNVFHGLNKGAESSLSGLIASAAAYEVIAKAFAASSASAPKRNLLFGFVGNEGYGLAGSRRMVHALNSNANAVGKCSWDDVSYVVEVGSVGLAREAKDFFLHMTSDSQPSNASVFDFFQTAAKNSEGGIAVHEPSGTPGIPPSSLMSFQDVVLDGDQEVKKSIPGSVFTDFNQTLRNKYLSSYMDDGKNVNMPSILAASELIARALYMVAHNSSAEPLDIDRKSLNATVYGLAECLFTSDPGMQCSLVQQVTDSYLSDVSLYPGVMPFPIKNEQNPNDKTDFVRFVWNFLATRSEGLPKLDELADAVPCNYPSGKLKCPGKNEVCARWRSKEKGSNGRCVNATVEYVPAWSQLLTYDIQSGKWNVNGTADTIEDEIWTESYWPVYTPSASVYLTEGYAYEMVLFFAGLGSTLVWFGLMRRANSHIAKQMKQW